MSVFHITMHQGYQREGVCLDSCTTFHQVSTCLKPLLVKVNNFTSRFKTTATRKTKTSTKKHTIHFKKIIMAYAGEGIYLSLCMEPHQHTETEAFYGSRKLHFTSYLALCIILKIATLWKHLSARINCSWKKNLPNKKVRFCKFPESSSLSQITVRSLKNTYVS